MFRPFADPLLVAAECRPRPQAVPLKPFAFTTRFPSHASPAAKQTACLVGSDAQSTCGKAPPSLMPCREAAAPLAGQIWRSPPLVTRGHVADRSRTAPNR